MRHAYVWKARNSLFLVWDKIIRFFKGRFGRIRDQFILNLKLRVQIAVIHADVKVFIISEKNEV